MKNTKSLILLLAIVAAVAGCNTKTEKVADYPMFWTWMNYSPGMNFDSVCAVMHETGLDGVILNAPTPDDYRKAIPIAHEHGIEVYAWLWTTNPEHDRDVLLKEHPDWFSVNRKGESPIRWCK